MEKTNKYYSIIEKIVVNHKKYPGLETIKDDIINDVYSHSEVIINSVNNEDVINAYLSKVVSTSIITVPRKMNFHVEIAHKEISIEPKNTERTKYVDNMINGVVSNSTEKEQDIVETNKDTEADEIITENLYEDTTGETLVENNDRAIFEEEAIENIKNETSLDEIEDIEILQQNNIEEINEVELASQDSFEESSISEIELTEPESEQEILQNNIDNNQILIESDVQDSLTETLSDDLTTGNIQPINELDINDGENDDLSIMQTEENISSDNQEDITSLDLEETDLQTMDLDILTPEIDANELSIENSSQENIDDIESTVQNTDYSLFAYNPENIDQNISTQGLDSAIEKLNEQFPNLNIIEVYNLKYKNNDSVSEIALKLKMEESAVVDALNELISII